MRAYTRDRYGGPEVLRRATMHAPRATGDEVVIRIEAMSLNRSDWEMLTARPRYVRFTNGLLVPRNAMIGSDMAGVVESVGPDASRFSPGDAVFGDLLWHSPRCLAEVVCSSETAPLTIKPDGLSFVDASTLPQAGSLALQALTEIRPIGPDDRVLVIGGGGGAGTFAIQLARHFGATVDGVDRAGKLDLMRSLGASEAFDHAVDDFAASGRRYTRIVDFAGRRSIAASRSVLTDEGIYFMVGGTVPRLLQVLVSGAITTRRSTRTMKLLMAKTEPTTLDTLAELVLSGAIRPVIDRTYSLEDAVDAVARLGSEQALGKLVVTP